MPKCVIDGREVEFQPGQNLIEVARKAGIEIPYFCYHPGLSIAGQCRMCSVEIEKMPKLQTACSTEPREGMVVKTRSERSRQNQRGVMEFLLINHPLDCPICDKSGECDLQDQSFKYGDAYSRYTEERRTYVDLDMGPVIQKSMNRCIHCFRCVRFGAEVAGIREMVATQRGNDVEISTVDGKPLQTAYSGMYSDICPTGSLTLKDFRFQKRVWFLTKTASTCEGCARGCSFEIHHEAGRIYRCVSRANPEVNRFWICDEGRFNFHYVHSVDRITEPLAGWASAIAKAKEVLAGRKLVVLVGSDLTQEEVALLQHFVPAQFPGAQLLHFGTPGIVSPQDDGDEDKILKRKSKTSNLHGVEKLGVQGFRAMPKGVDAALVFRGGRAVLPDLSGLRNVVGVGVFDRTAVQGYNVVLPGLTFAEKSGTIVNFQGRAQGLVKALDAPGSARELGTIIGYWTGGVTP